MALEKIKVTTDRFFFIHSKSSQILLNRRSYFCIIPLQNICHKKFFNIFQSLIWNAFALMILFNGQVPLEGADVLPTYYMPNHDLHTNKMGLKFAFSFSCFGFSFSALLKNFRRSLNLLFASLCVVTR